MPVAVGRGGVAGRWSRGRAGPGEGGLRLGEGALDGSCRRGLRGVGTSRMAVLIGIEGPWWLMDERHGDGRSEDRTRRRRKRRDELRV